MTEQAGWHFVVMQDEADGDRQDWVVAVADRLEAEIKLNAEGNLPVGRLKPFEAIPLDSAGLAGYAIGPGELKQIPS